MDFLTQCVPRMNALIEAGLNGQLNEVILERCLKVNDQLMRVVESGESIRDLDPDLDQGTTTDLIDFTMDNLSLKNHDSTSVSVSPSASASALPCAPAMAMALPSSDALAQDDWDDFDDFLETRTKTATRRNQKN